MKCKEQGCKGKIDLNKKINIKWQEAYPCNKCGRLHLENGNPLPPISALKGLRGAVYLMPDGTIKSRTILTLIDPLKR